MKIRQNKKVLLRERKRHTARRVVTTPSVVLTDLVRGGYPARGVPYLGTPQAGYPPILTWPGGVPYLGTPQQGTLTPRVPPSRVPPSRLDLAGYPPVSAPWHSGKCCKALWDMGNPPCGQTD